MKKKKWKKDLIWNLFEKNKNNWRCVSDRRKNWKRMERESRRKRNRKENTLQMIHKLDSATKIFTCFHLPWAIGWAFPFPLILNSSIRKMAAAATTVVIGVTRNSVILLPWRLWLSILSILLLLKVSVVYFPSPGLILAIEYCFTI